MREFLSLIFLFLSSYVFADITLVGEGTAKVEPNVALVTVSVVSEDVKAEVALRKNSEVMNLLTDKLLNNFKIERKHLFTTNFSLTPKYEYPTNKEPKFVGYLVNNNLTVRYSDLDKLGNLIDELVKNGANRVYGVNFLVENTEDLLDEARKKAVKDAKRKANLYAKEFGFEIDKVISVNENSRFVPRNFSGELGNSADVPNLSPGEKEIKISIGVVFSLKK